MIRVGFQVVRGKHWMDGDEDGGGEGTVTYIDTENYYLGDRVHVKWPNGNNGWYEVGPCAYEVKLARHS